MTDDGEPQELPWSEIRARRYALLPAHRRPQDYASAREYLADAVYGAPEPAREVQLGYPHLKRRGQ
ncbi:MAG: hypothetical protein IT481_08545 [Gammaproteobacteria bacterium]|nr:hypothetical protein [Gammaproteobacteria bacterium]